MFANLWDITSQSDTTFHIIHSDKSYGVNIKYGVTFNGHIFSFEGGL